MNYEDLLEKTGFRFYFEELKQRFKNKRILIYGAGEFFKYLYNNYDFSGINIIGISDKSFETSSETYFENIPIIRFSDIKKQKPDCVLMSILNWQKILLINYQQNIFSKNTKVFPIYRESLFDTNLSKMIENIFYSFPNYMTFRLLLDLQEHREEKAYIQILQNYKKVKKRLRKNNKKIRVGFLCYDSARWKNQSLYDLLDKDNMFEPIILFTRLYTDKQTRIQTESEFWDSYNFFKNKGMNIELAYNIETNTYLDLKTFSPDYVFYQLPFYCHPIQAPDIVSHFALTAYVPYYTGTSLCETSKDLDFRAKLSHYYLANDGLKEYYQPLMRNKGKNISVVGHPALDSYYHTPYCDKKDNNTFQVLYSPHHSIEENSPIHLSTFLENGEFILNYAKKHSDIKWVFRPHPLLKKVLETVWDKNKIDEYYKTWEDIGILDEGGDYIEIFKDTDLLINDCGYFSEFFPTGNPIIQLINPKACQYDKISTEIIDSCYTSHNNEELLYLMNLLIEQREDTKKTTRLEVIKHLNLKNIFAAQNILDNIKEDLKFTILKG